MIAASPLSQAECSSVYVTQCIWHFHALWSSCGLNTQVQFADNKLVIVQAVCTTHTVSQSDIFFVFPSYYDIINEMRVFGAKDASMTSCCELADGRLF